MLGLTKIHSTTGRIVKIVKDLKSFSRDIGNGPYEKVNIRHVIESTFELCRSKYAAHKVDLQILSISDIQLECRPIQISQVLLNFLDNALDAVANAVEKWVRIEVVDEGENVVVKMSDSGPGVRPEIQERILQPFLPTKAAGKGMGFGPSIYKKIAEQHGGKLVVNEEGGRTVFSLTLPKSRGAPRVSA